MPLKSVLLYRIQIEIISVFIKIDIATKSFSVTMEKECHIEIVFALKINEYIPAASLQLLSSAIQIISCFYK